MPPNVDAFNRSVPILHLNKSKLNSVQLCFGYYYVYMCVVGFFSVFTYSNVVKKKKKTGKLAETLLSCHNLLKTSITNCRSTLLTITFLTYYKFNSDANLQLYNKNQNLEAQTQAYL